MSGSQNVAPVTNSASTFTYITFYTPGTYTGNVTNSGTLSPAGTYPANSPGSATGISVLELGTTLVGNIINTGAINASGNHAGINIGEGRTANPNESNAGAALVGSITNSGTITAPDDIYVFGNSSQLSTVTGSIINAVGGHLINRDVGINLDFATVGGSITNFGTITTFGGAGGVGINVAFSDLGSTGTPGSGNIVNATGASIASTYIGIVVNGNVAGGTATIAGSIINNGNITVPNAGTAQGIEVAAGSVLGGVTNTATIDSAIGIELFGVINKIALVGGDIVNQGHINALSTNGSNGGIEIFGFEGGGPAIVGGSIVNSGTINVSGVSGTNDGILLSGAHVAGGVTNSSTLSVGGGAVSVGIAVAKSGGANFAPPNSSIGGSVVNLGSITAGTGVLVSGGSTVAGGISNASGGTITGVQTGIMLSTGSVVIGGVTNGGDLSGGAVAIDVSGEGAATTITQAGGVITGDILLSALGDTVDVTGGAIDGDIDGTGSGTVDFTLGTGTFTYSNTILGVQAVNFNSGTVVLDGAIDPATLTIAASATLSIGNGASLDPGITDNGTFSFDQSGAFSYGAIAGNGAVEQIGTGTTTLIGVDSVSGGTDIAAGILVLGSGGSIANNAAFDGTSATLQFDSGTNQLGGDIAGAVVGDAFDLHYQTFATGDHAVWSQNGSTGTLSIETATNSVFGTLTLAGQYTTADFRVTADNQNDVMVNVVTPQAPEDFNGDGRSDILFLNSTTTQLGYYDQITDSFYVWHFLGTTSSSYQALGTGYFDGDGIADILWRNPTNGDIGYYDVTGNSYTWNDLGLSDTAYSVVGIGDFNGDGISDILFRDSATTDTGYYQLSGGSYTWHDLGSTSSAYDVAGVGDFNGDGTSDILWRDPINGDIGAYELSGGSYSWVDFGLSDPAYNVVGIGDFNGDGVSDILFRNPTTTDLGYYQIVGNAATWHDLGSTSAAYSVVGVGDYNGDGISDVFWRNNSTGDIGYYQLASGGGSYTWHDAGLSSTAYHIVAQTPLS